MGRWDGIRPAALGDGRQLPYELKTVAAILGAPATEEILTHRGLKARASLLMPTPDSYNTGQIAVAAEVTCRSRPRAACFWCQDRSLHLTDHGRAAALLPLLPG
jgi:hypothetical protein